MADNHGVVVAGGDPGAEFLTVPAFKVLPGCYKDVRRGIKLEPFRRPLLRDVVGNHNQGLGAKPQSLHLHGGGDHFKSLAGTYLVSQQCIAAVEDMGNGIDLVFPQGDFRVHAGETDVAAVILTGTDGVKGFVVNMAQFVSAVNVFPDPLGEFLLDQLLPVLSDGGFLFV